MKARGRFEKKQETLTCFFLSLPCSLGVSAPTDVLCIVHSWNFDQSIFRSPGKASYLQLLGVLHSKIFKLLKSVCVKQRDMHNKDGKINDFLAHGVNLF